MTADPTNYLVTLSSALWDYLGLYYTDAEHEHEEVMDLVMELVEAVEERA